MSKFAKIRRAIKKHGQPPPRRCDRCGTTIRADQRWNLCQDCERIVMTKERE